MVMDITTLHTIKGKGTTNRNGKFSVLSQNYQHFLLKNNISILKQIV